MSRVIAQSAAAVGCLLIGAHLWLMAGSLLGAMAEREETEKLRKLATITLQQFSDPNALSEKEFWKSIGRAEPMVDSWGSPYRLERRDSLGKPEFFWRSPGPDGRLGTPDDLEVQVPFVEGKTPDWSTLEKDHGFPAIDAK